MKGLIKAVLSREYSIFNNHRCPRSIKTVNKHTIFAPLGVAIKQKPPWVSSLHTSPNFTTSEASNKPCSLIRQTSRVESEPSPHRDDDKQNNTMSTQSWTSTCTTTTPSVHLLRDHIIIPLISLLNSRMNSVLSHYIHIHR